ncbi:MAG TPA: hypothetical protein VHW69_02500, partial [Rhizomicrobium sp.]|nr:hypothetical protein [Rhizomicrobium sp.]
MIYSFQAGLDGEFPYPGVIDKNGTLYGTTESGGDYTRGILFAVDQKTGTERVLYHFGAGADGRNPVAGLIDDKGATVRHNERWRHGCRGITAVEVTTSDVTGRRRSLIPSFPEIRGEGPFEVV